MNNKLCTVGSLMSGKSWWKWALFGLLALYSLLLVSRCSPIEQDLQSRTTDALNEKGLNWAKPTLEKRGRDVMLSGMAPSEEAREQAINTAADVYGVRVVDNDITLKQYETPVFGLLNNDEGKTVLTGSFPEQGLIDQAVRAASDNFGADNVVNEMTVSEDVSSPSWLPAALGVIPAIVAMKNADLDINNDNASLNGTFNTEEEKQSLMELASSGFGDKFTDNSTVTPILPTAEELAEIARKAEEAEAARIAEEAEATRLAEEKRITEEAEAARLVEEKRIADAAEAKRMTNQKSMAVIMLAAVTAREAKAEAGRIAEEKLLAAKAEAARLVEEKRLAAEAVAEATRIANEKRMADIMLAAQKGREDKAEAARLVEEKRLAEEQRLATEAEAARVANQKAMAAIMLAAQEGREAKAQADAEAARIANEKAMAVIMLAAQEGREAKAQADAEAARIANEKAMAAIMLAAQEGREAKAQADAEAARIANEKAMAVIMLAAQKGREDKAQAEAEAARIANEKAMAAIMLAAQKGREDKVQAEAEAARIANEKAMAAIMLAAQKGREAKAQEKRAAERKRQAASRDAALAEQKRKDDAAKQKRQEERAKAAALAKERRQARDKAEADRLAAENVNRHTHPSNQFTNAVTHKHVSGDSNHVHNYGGNSQKRAPAQKIRHSHPQNQYSKAITHAHANGGNTHAHNYGAGNQQRVISSLERQVAAIAAAPATGGMTNSGCQQSINATMRGQRILFATASASIDSQSYGLLNRLSQRIRSCQKRVQVSGHTDSRGAANMNMKLSQDRARAVRNYLRNKGAGRSVISSRGYGETRPVANNNSAAGRRLNRRIQFTILK